MAPGRQHKYFVLKEEVLWKEYTDELLEYKGQLQIEMSKKLGDREGWSDEAKNVFARVNVTTFAGFVIGSGVTTMDNAHSVDWQFIEAVRQFSNSDVLALRFNYDRDYWGNTTAVHGSQFPIWKPNNPKWQEFRAKLLNSYSIGYAFDNPQAQQATPPQMLDEDLTDDEEEPVVDDYLFLDTNAYKKIWNEDQWRIKEQNNAWSMVSKMNAVSITAPRISWTEKDEYVYYNWNNINSVKL